MRPYWSPEYSGAMPLMSGLEDETAMLAIKHQEGY